MDMMMIKMSTRPEERGPTMGKTRRLVQEKLSRLQSHLKPIACIVSKEVSPAVNFLGCPRSEAANPPALPGFGNSQFIASLALVAFVHL